MSIDRKIATYLVLTFALSSIFYYLILSAGSIRAGGGLYVFGVMWCPGVAAIVTRLVYQKNLRGMGWGWGKTRYQLWSYLLPPLAGLAVYGAVWASGIGGVTGEKLAEKTGGSLHLALLLFATVGVLSSMVSALGEEIGWRGFLVPELAKRTSFERTWLVSAVVWSLFHYPILIFADYNSGTPVGYALACFTVSVFAISVVFAWLRLKSGSLWTAVILHASHNLFIQAVFDKVTVDQGTTRYITTEFGAGLALVYSLVAVYFWRRRGELPQPGETPPKQDPGAAALNATAA